MGVHLRCERRAFPLLSFANLGLFQAGHEMMKLAYSPSKHSHTLQPQCQPERFIFLRVDLNLQLKVSFYQNKSEYFRFLASGARCALPLSLCLHRETKRISGHVMCRERLSMTSFGRREENVAHLFHCKSLKKNLWTLKIYWRLTWKNSERFLNKWRHLSHK